jgi:hypothetical protein
LGSRKARSLKPEQIVELLKKIAQPTATGRFEPFKTTNRFDSTAKHPENASKARVAGVGVFAAPRMLLEEAHSCCECKD